MQIKNFRTIYYCISNYPTIRKTNMLCMKTMKQKFRVPIGFSDHTTSNEASLVAVTLEPEIIEKHFALDKKLKGLIMLYLLTKSLQR